MARTGVPHNDMHIQKWHIPLRSARLARPHPCRPRIPRARAGGVSGGRRCRHGTALACVSGHPARRRPPEITAQSPVAAESVDAAEARNALQEQAIQ
eukprot:1382091-Alexandrium_andersonii.AAC.1